MNTEGNIENVIESWLESDQYKNRWFIINWIVNEFRSLATSTISITALWVWIVTFANQSYKWITRHSDKDYLSVDQKVEKIINNEEQWRIYKLKHIIYSTCEIYLIKAWVEATEAKELAKWLIKEIESKWIIDDIIPKPKPGWVSALFALIYVYLYTKTIRKIQEDHSTVSTFSFAWFSTLNWWFAISNWILDPWSLWYISAWIMWAITVIINEKEKKRQRTSLVDAEDVEPDVNKEILLDYANCVSHPVVIYKDSGSWFPNEKPKFWNPAMESLTWYSKEEVADLTQKDIMELLYGHDEVELEKVMNQLTWLHNTWFWYRDKVFRMRTKSWTLIDVAWHTEKVKWWWRISFWSTDRAEIQQLLRHDSNFWCLNDRAFKEDMNEFYKHINDLGWVEEWKVIAALIYCDIDKFKWVNDTYWHFAWDVILNGFIKYIEWELRRKDDNLYRIHWDEFVIVCKYTDKHKLIDRIRYFKDEFSKRTYTITYHKWQLSFWFEKYDSHKEATEVFEKYKEDNPYIYDNWSELTTKDKVSERLEWKTIVLPPITTSWWITDLNYESEKTSNPITTKEYIESMLNVADRAMYMSKKWRNDVNMI